MTIATSEAYHCRIHVELGIESCSSSLPTRLEPETNPRVRDSKK